MVQYNKTLLRLSINICKKQVNLSSYQSKLLCMKAWVLVLDKGLIEQMLSTFLYRLSGHGTLHLL